jgi:diketogulonate reductase-like aldo/keto reductase
MSRAPTSHATATALVNQTLANSGLDYLDLLLIHAPYGGPETRKTLWRALVEAQEAGKVRSLGVSNYGVHHLDELEDHIKELEQERGPGKGGVVSVGQWEIHPWLPRHDIVAWCAARNIVVQAYCPVVRATKMDDPLLAPLVEKYKKTPAQVLLRWSLQMGLCPLPKSVTFSRIEENRDLYDFELEDEEVRALDTGAYEPCAWDPTVEPLEK